MPFFGKILKFCFNSFHDGTDSRFVFKFHGNRPREVRCFGAKETRKVRFSSAPFSARLVYMKSDPV